MSRLWILAKVAIRRALIDAAQALIEKLRQKR